MHRSELGTLGEIKAAAHFASEGYEVYVPFGGKSRHDLLLNKGRVILRVEVKTTQTKDAKSGSWLVQLRSIRSNRTENVIKHFDSSQCDIIAVYIEPEDRIEILQASEYEGRSTVSFKERCPSLV
jgi:Holliday junction resolvase-like predicted endonuclease